MVTKKAVNSAASMTNVQPRQQNIVSKEIIAGNLRWLMDNDSVFSNPQRVHREATLRGMTLSQSGVVRALAGEGAMTTDTVDRFAALFKRQPWELLRPGLEAQDKAISADEERLLEAYPSTHTSSQEDILFMVAAHASRHPQPAAKVATSSKRKAAGRKG